MRLTLNREVVLANIQRRFAGALREGQGIGDGFAEDGAFGGPDGFGQIRESAVRQRQPQFGEKQASA